MNAGRGHDTAFDPGTAYDWVFVFACVQVDWRMIKHGDGTKLWRAIVPGSVWCMIRTRTTVPASPMTVLNFLLDDDCIPQYDELFDKIEVVEAVDDNSVFKRT